MNSPAERIAAKFGRFIGRILKVLISLADDLLLLAGCGCILYGLSLWNIVITWIAGGLMLIGLAVMIGKAKAKNAAERLVE